jgi:hypothetical protein
MRIFAVHSLRAGVLTMDFYCEIIAKGDLPDGTNIPRWFRRVGEIQQLSSFVPSGIEREQIEGHDEVPEAGSYYYDSVHDRLVPRWKHADDGYPVSPASRHVGKQEPRIFSLNKAGGLWFPADAIRIVSEAIELPGEPYDYHQILLKGARLSATSGVLKVPNSWARIEEFCWLDIYLAELFPDIVQRKQSPNGQSVSSPPFGTLMELYERQARLDEARSVAELALGYPGFEAATERLIGKSRIANREEELAQLIRERNPPQHRNGPAPKKKDGRIIDWAFRAAEPRGTGAGSELRGTRSPTGWGSHAAWSSPDLWEYPDSRENPYKGLKKYSDFRVRFDSAWISEASGVAENLIPYFQFAWPWLIVDALQAQSPDAWNAIKEFHENIRPSRSPNRTERRMAMQGYSGHPVEVQANYC